MNIRIKQKLSTWDSGSYLVETAVFLPVFIIAILTIGCVIKVIGAYENMNHSVCDEMSDLAAHSYHAEESAIGFKGDLKKRIEDDVPEITGVRIDDFKYLSRDPLSDKLITVSVSGNINFNMPLDFKKGTDIKQRWMTRAFVGRTVSRENMDFDEMEEAGDSQIVYIFPDAGEKYHSGQCTYVKSNVTQMVLNNEIKKHYSPCPLCAAKTLNSGSTIYCFLNYGGAYHSGDCRTINKYTVKIEKSEAEEKGYTPCSKCGGIADEKK